MGEYEERRGFVEPWQLGELLGALGFMVATREEQERVSTELGRAREAAAHVGVVDAEAEGQVSFWVLVQLLRVLFSRDDKLVLDREARAAEQTGFNSREVDEFREVFSACHQHDRVFEGPTDDTTASLDGLPGWRAVGDEAPELSKNCMRRLLRNLGVSLNPEHRSKLERKIDEFGTQGHVNFADFLRLMRWMLDTNFADIQSKAAKVANDANA